MALTREWLKKEKKKKWPDKSGVFYIWGSNVNTTLNIQPQ